MSSSMWGYLFLILGIIAAALLLLFGGINTKDENNYYILKEATQNAMLDSVDNVAYHVGLTQEEVDQNSDIISCKSGVSGTVRIISEKFVENFARRYAEVAPTNYTYRVEIYDIQECPAKVTLRVISKQNYSWVKRLLTREVSGKEAEEEAFIVNDLSAILETKD